MVADELVPQLRAKVEEEKIALVGFVREIDSHISSTKPGFLTPSSSISNLSPYRPTFTPLSERQPKASTPVKRSPAPHKKPSPSPFRESSFLSKSQSRRLRTPNLLEEDEVELLVGDFSLVDTEISFSGEISAPASPTRRRPATSRDKENVPIVS